MRKGFQVILMAMVLAVMVTGMANAAIRPSFIGISGGVLTPNDQVLSVGDFGANFHMIDLDGRQPYFLGANFGITTNLEIGISRFDSDTAGNGVDTILNAKYLVLPEQDNSPSLIVGVVDAGGQVSNDDDPSFYALIGKNLTPTVSNAQERVQGSLLAYVGFGDGIYEGFFFGLDYALSPTSNIVLEYIDDLNFSGLITDDSVFNAGVNFALTGGLDASLALVNSDDLGFGVTYRKPLY